MSSVAYTLYRFFNAEDTLLYVGMSINPGRRMEKHRATQPWWSEVSRIAMEQYPDLETLRAAEREAIKAEAPLYNVRMNGDFGKQRAPFLEEGLPKRLLVNEVYALGLGDGTCPVGLITEGSPEGVVLVKFDWMICMFNGNDEWIPAEMIKRWVRAERMSEGQKRADGWVTDKTVFEMQPLGDFQTEWVKNWQRMSGPGALELAALRTALRKAKALYDEGQSDASPYECWSEFERLADIFEVRGDLA